MTAQTDTSDFKKLKVQDLRDELKKRDLDTSGTKPVLLARLEEAVQKGPPATPEESQPASAAAGGSPAAVPSGTAAVTEAETGKPEATIAVPQSAADTAPTETETEKAKKRAERFGIVFNDSAKPANRQDTSTAANSKKPSAVGKAVEEADPGEIARRKDRAKRFGMPVPTFAAEEHEKRKARAQRFEMSEGGTTLEQKAKLDKRKERFGVAAPAAANGSAKGSTNPKLEARAKRFGSGSMDSAELDAKKKARAERFGAS